MEVRVYLYARNHLRSYTTLGLHTLGRTSNPLTFKGFTLSRSTPFVVFSVTCYLDLRCAITFSYKPNVFYTSEGQIGC